MFFDIALHSNGEQMGERERKRERLEGRVMDIIKINAF